MIATMQEYYSILARLRKQKDEMDKSTWQPPGGFVAPFQFIEVLEVMELRIRRLEDQAGIPVPDDLVRLRELNDRR